MTHLDGAPTVLDHDRRGTAGAPARPGAGGDGGGRGPQSHGDRPDARARCADRPRLRHDRALRSLHAQRVAGRLVGAATGRPGTPAGPPGRRDDPGRPDPGGRRGDERRPARRPDDGRDRDARQQRDGGLLQRPRGAPRHAFRGGWLHSGDLGVQHSDGYVELRDRAKDIIISGGENISTVEIEHAIESHPAVLEAAVIGVPDDKWGERPKAFVLRRPGAEVDEAELIGLPPDPHRQVQGARARSSSSTNSHARPQARSRSSSSAKRNGPATPAGSRDEGRDMLADETYDETTLATTEIGRSLGTDYFGLRDELTDAERDYLKRTRDVRRQRGAAGHQRLLGARRVPVGADQEDGHARHRRRRHRGLRVPRR